MRETEQDIFSLFESGFMLAYCARRVDGRRCPNKPFCQNSTTDTGRYPTPLQRAHDIHANLMQHVTHVKKGLVKFDWETAEDQVGELMTLKLCVKHQDCCDLTVECAMKLLQNECQRCVAVKQFSAPRQPTTNLQYHRTPQPTKDDMQRHKPCYLRSPKHLPRRHHLRPMQRQTKCPHPPISPRQSSSTMPAHTLPRWTPWQKEREPSSPMSTRSSHRTHMFQHARSRRYPTLNRRTARQHHPQSIRSSTFSRLTPVRRLARAYWISC